jgi:beta-glucosidase
MTRTVKTREKVASPPYLNPKLSTDKRVKDLLSRMMLEEKAAQMMCVWQEKANTLVNEEGKFDLQKARKHFKKGHGLGQVGRPSDVAGGQNALATAELTNAIQKFFLEESRLGIPVIFHENVCMVMRPSTRPAFRNRSDSPPPSILSWSNASLR